PTRRTAQRSVVERFGASRAGRTSRGDVDELDRGGGRRYRLARVLEPFDMKLDGLLYEAYYFLASRASGHAARQVRDVCAEAGFARFNDYCIAHVSASPLELRLLEYRTKSSGRHVGARLAGDRDGSGFGRVPVLT